MGEEYLIKLLDRISLVYYNVGPKKQPNLMEDLFSSLMGPAPSAPKQVQSEPVIEEMD